MCLLFPVLIRCFQNNVCNGVVAINLWLPRCQHFEHMTTNGINSQIEMNNETNVTVDSPPTPITADYIEMIFLTIMISIGVPLNVYVLTTLCHQYQSAPKNGLKAAYILMKININLSDLVLLLGYCLGKLLWMATYSWEGGDALCKIYEFVVMFGLYLSSNMVISISIDRLKNVLSAKKIRGDVVCEVFAHRSIIFRCFKHVFYSLHRG